jgi:hypothetical protein
LQPNESVLLSTLHLVLMTPLVGQPELSFMQVQIPEAPDDVHAAGTFLQPLGVHADVDES